MAGRSQRSANIAGAVETALENDGVSDVTHVNDRECSSDRFSGVELKCYGPYISIRPIIDVVAERDGLGIESVAGVDDDDQCVNVFIAYLPEQDHPAFV